MKRPREKRITRWATWNVTSLMGKEVEILEKYKTKQVFEARPEGTRRRGRPRKEWIQYIGEMTSIQQVKQLAGNRNGWQTQR